MERNALKLSGRSMTIRLHIIVREVRLALVVALNSPSPGPRPVAGVDSSASVHVPEIQYSSPTATAKVGRDVLFATVWPGLRSAAGLAHTFGLTTSDRLCVLRTRYPAGASSTRSLAYT